MSGSAKVFQIKIFASQFLLKIFPKFHCMDQKAFLRLNLISPHCISEALINVVTSLTCAMDGGGGSWKKTLFYPFLHTKWYKGMEWSRWKNLIRPSTLTWSRMIQSNMKFNVIKVWKPFFANESFFGVVQSGYLFLSVTKDPKIFWSFSNKSFALWGVT